MIISREFISRRIIISSKDDPQFFDSAEDWRRKKNRPGLKGPVEGYPDVALQIMFIDLPKIHATLYEAKCSVS